MGTKQVPIIDNTNRYKMGTKIGIRKQYEMGTKSVPKMCTRNRYEMGTRNGYEMGTNNP